MDIQNHSEACQIISELNQSQNALNCCKLWGKVSKILTHDDWYSKSDLENVRNAAKASKGLTPKQRAAAAKTMPARDEQPGNRGSYIRFDGWDDPDRYQGHGYWEYRDGYFDVDD
jgi:hypothetical protein